MKKVIKFLCFPRTAEPNGICEINIKTFNWFIGGYQENYLNSELHYLDLFRIKSKKRKCFGVLLNKKDVKIFKQL